MPVKAPEEVSGASEEVAPEEVSVRMPVKAFILIRTGPAKSVNVVNAVSEIEGVKMAHVVTGSFDIIAYAEVTDLKTLTDIVLAKIQWIDGVERTQTAIVVTPPLIVTPPPFERVEPLD